MIHLNAFYPKVIFLLAASTLAAWASMATAQSANAASGAADLAGAVSPAASAQPRDMLTYAQVLPRVGQEIPAAAQFFDHAGAPIRLGKLFGKRPVVLCLVYFECPMLCKLAADGLVRSVAGMGENVGEDFDIVFASFDPRDTPARAAAARDHALKQYARPASAAGWRFLTGSQENIHLLTEAVGFHYAWDEDSQQFAHASGLVIVSEQGVITEYLDGINFSPADLREAVNRARVNQLTERESLSFVRCYLYDPVTGRFGAAVQWTVRVLGLATAAGLAAGVYYLGRRSNVTAHEVDHS